MAALNVSVVSADREVWSGEATMVVARTVEGEIGILPGHEPMLANLAGGEVRVTLPGGEKITANAEDGFLSVHADAVQVVASRAELA
ncbi:F0F1 ATP synthase subunit epsilon [Agromyces sp. NPDC049794]|uniref:F0F1 ATP synthase subunit epsilon n=1 Tax=unclassified Agromyces TaxID=2639701 RepID=UPI00340D4319